MEIQFTKDQQAVIEHQDGNLLVSAAAGSGKTAVLVERIVQMLTRPKDPVPVDQILVVTFTNAAARQMKEKIESRIRQALEKQPDDPFLEEQYHSLSMASIMTNHAFCLQLLQDYITRIPGLDPGFRVADETEMQLLRADVLAGVLEDFYTQALQPEITQESQDFLSFIDAYGGTRQDTQVEELLLQVYDFMESDPNPIAWLEKAVNQMDPQTWAQEEQNPWLRLAEEQIERELATAVSLHGQLMDLLTDADEKGKNAGKAGKLITDLWETVGFLKTEKAYREQAMACRRIRWPKMSYTVFKEDPMGDQQARQLTDQMKKAFGRVGELYDVYFSPKAEERLTQLVVPAMRGMERLLKAFDEAYRQKKIEKNLVEFSDFEHGALAILQDPAVAEDVRRRYRYIYIDEYQDSNPLQEAIIERIARCDENGQACNVFMVGDVKQSIYRFRQADPTLFLEKYESYGTRPNTKKLVLGQNFRSQRPVLEAVNFVFEALMNRESGELDYGPEERLYPGRSAEEETLPPAELWVLEDAEEMDSEQRNEAQARMVAGEMKRLAEAGVPYRDMVILMRSVSQQGEIYRKALEKAGVPAYAESSENFYDTQEIQTVMNLLHVIDNPHQDIPLLGVLYSPIGNLSEEELGQVRLAAQEADFYDALRRFGAQDKQDVCHEKVRRFLEQLQHWRAVSENSSVHDLLWKLYEETGYYLYAGAMPGGRLRRANLDLLLEKSVAFEKGIYSGLYQFLRYVEKLDKNRKSQDEAKILGEEENLVRIMTIHKSKGLEFPVVFVAGLGRRWNTNDLDRGLLMHRKLGLGADAVDSRHYVKYPSMTKTVLREQLHREMAAEEMRLLYVAMTRAKERLYMIGARKIREEALAGPVAGWKMPARRALEARSYLDWLEEIVQKKAGSPIRYVRMQIEELEQEAQPVESPEMSERELPEGAAAWESEIEKRFNWEYPQQWRGRVPVRLSVSQIKQRQLEGSAAEEETPQEEEKAFFAKPAGGNEGGADRGTAFHTAMAQAGWTQLHSRPELEQELRRLVLEGKLTAEEEKLVNRKWLLDFGASALYQRIQNSRAVYREKPFMMSLSLDELKAMSPQMDYGTGPERIMVQGIVDCYFEEEDGLVLVDYKTDRELDEKRLEGYRLQLAFYARALEGAVGKPVKERILYDVRRGREIAC